MYYDLVVKQFKERGVEIEDIANLVYELQKAYVSYLTYEVCHEAVVGVLNKREVQHAIMTGIAIDMAVENDEIRGPLKEIINRDEGLYGIDEIIALSICNVYGTIALTNFGYVDKLKPGIIGKVDKAGKRLDKCNTFLDDLVGAVAAAAASRIAHGGNNKID